MGDHLTYEESIKMVYRGLVLLAVVTLVEVAISLFGKGHLIPGMEDLSWVAYVAGFLIIALSVYKAYFIVYDFMHMRYEVKGMAMSVILPMLLLVWGIIAFFQEGNAWKERRLDVKQRNAKVAQSPFLDAQGNDVKIIDKKEDSHEGHDHGTDGGH